MLAGGILLPSDSNKSHILTPENESYLSCQSVMCVIKVLKSHDTKVMNRLNNSYRIHMTFIKFDLTVQ